MYIEEELRERFELSYNRIKELPEELSENGDTALKDDLREFFLHVSKYISGVFEAYGVVGYDTDDEMRAADEARAVDEKRPADKTRLAIDEATDKVIADNSSVMSLEQLRI